MSSLVSLDDMRVAVQAPQGQFSFTIGYNTGAGPNTYTVGDGHYEASYYDVDGDGMLGAGDRMTLGAAAGPLDNGSYSITLLYVPNGAVIGAVSASLP